MKLVQIIITCDEDDKESILDACADAEVDNSFETEVIDVTD